MRLKDVVAYIMSADWQAHGLSSESQDELAKVPLYCNGKKITRHDYDGEGRHWMVSEIERASDTSGHINVATWTNIFNSNDHLTDELWFIEIPRSQYTYRPYWDENSVQITDCKIETVDGKPALVFYT